MKMYKILKRAMCLYEDIHDEKIDTKDAFLVVYLMDSEDLICEKASKFSKNFGDITKNLNEKQPFMAQDPYDEKTKLICFLGSELRANKFKEFCTRFIAQDLEPDIDDYHEPEIQITDIDSSQEIQKTPNKSEKDLKASIVNKLDKIEDLVKEVRSSLLENKRQKTSVKDLGQRTANKQQVLEKYGYTRKQSIRFSIVPSKDESRITKQEIKRKFQVALYRCRSDIEWLKNIHQFNIEGIPADTMKGIRNTLAAGSSVAGYFVRKIARLLFSDEKLMTTKIFDPNVKYPGVKAKNRMKNFSEKDEKILKQIFSQIDQDLFESKDGWHILVRCPINQLGLDLKRDLKNKKKSDTIQIDSDHEAGPSGLNISQSNKDLDEAHFIIESDSE